MSSLSCKMIAVALIAAISLLSLSACSSVADTDSDSASSDLNSTQSEAAVSSESTSSEFSEASSKAASKTSSKVSSQTTSPSTAGNTADAWNLILVNPDHPLTKEISNHLIALKVAKVSKGKYFDERAAQDLYNMFDAAKKSGCNLYSRSTYRSFQLQQTYYDSHVNSYMKQGMTRAQAEKKTEEYTARPKSSEHHTGLAIDITTDEWEAANKGLSTSFENTEAAKWLRANAHKYGFILRYPKNKESITKVHYEPWHFRYVGVEAATKIYNQGICLEEYIATIK